MGLVLLAWVIAYIVFRSMPEVNYRNVNFIYWVFVLLISINITMRMDSHSNENNRLFLYTMVDASSVLFAKVLFNFLYLFSIALLFYFSLLIFMSPNIFLSGEYIFLILAGAFVISTCLTFVTCIGSYNHGQTTLISILSLPLLIPTVLVLTDMGLSMVLGQKTDTNQYLALASISLISMALSIIFFPMIWKQ